MRYRLHITPVAARSFDKLPEQAQIIYVRGIGHRERFYDFLKRLAKNQSDE